MNVQSGGGAAVDDKMESDRRGGDQNGRVPNAAAPQSRQRLHRVPVGGPWGRCQPVAPPSIPFGPSPARTLLPGPFEPLPPQKGESSMLRHRTCPNYI